MEISKCWNSKNDVESYIRKYFIPVDSNTTFDTLFPCTANYINAVDSLSFLGMRVEQCWVKKEGSLYAFFILIHESQGLEEAISSVYGNPRIKAQTYANDTPLGREYNVWQDGDINLELVSFRNLTKTKRYENCELLIAGNMSRRQLTGRH
jgi:hypothetical protein